MVKEKFVPISGLDNLTEQQKIEYYTQVCEHFELPVQLNLLEYIYMDSGDGARKLVLWAKKGATDTWRERLHISVKSLVKDEGEGYVAYTATGERDDMGRLRQEMAVGAAETKGKTGKALADAVMTAQTRAVRRMTLQFVGGGFLDETEVRSESVTSPLTSIPSAAIQTPPVVQPNVSVGRDITAVDPAHPPSYQPNAHAFTKLVSAPDAIETSRIPEVAQASAAKFRRKRRNTVDFTMPGVEEEVPPVIEAAVEPDTTPAVEPAPLHVTPYDLPVTVEPTPAIEAAINAAVEPVVEAAAQELMLVQTTSLLSAEDKKRFEEKMKHYRNTVLPIATPNNPQSFSTAGGMEPSAGLGGVAIKLRRYAEIMFATNDLKTLTSEQWERFFKHLDEYLEKFGAVKLVEQINGTVVPK